MTSYVKAGTASVKEFSISMSVDFHLYDIAKLRTSVLETE